MLGAQCGGNHFSLDASCPLVKKYKEELKEAIGQAAATGMITRTAPGELSRSFQRQVGDFPALTRRQTDTQYAWRPPTDTAHQNQLAQEVSALVAVAKTVSNTMVRIEKSLLDIENRVVRQEERITNHERKMNDVIATLQTMSQWVHANKSDRTKLKRSILKMVDDLQQREPNGHGVTGMSPQPSPIAPPPQKTTNNKDNITDEEADQEEDRSMNSEGPNV